MKLKVFLGLVVLALFFAAVSHAANGFYFIDQSGLAVWWVQNGETPAQALVRDLGVQDIENKSLDGFYVGPCVDTGLVYSLQIQFPEDPFVDLVPRCGPRLEFIPKR